MKSFMVSAFIIAANLVLIQSQEDEHKMLMNMKKQAIDDCTVEHPISQEAVKSITNHVSVPDEPQVKCWLACVYKKLYVMKEGKIDWEQCKMITKHCLTNDEAKAKLDQIIEICQVEVPNDEKDECQLAYDATVCKTKNWNNFGLSTSDMKESM